MSVTPSPPLSPDYNLTFDGEPDAKQRKLAKSPFMKFHHQNSTITVQSTSSEHELDNSIPKTYLAKFSDDVDKAYGCPPVESYEESIAEEEILPGWFELF